MPRKIMAALAAIAALGMVTVASSPADARGGFGFRGGGWGGPGIALGLAGLGIGLGVANAYAYYGGYGYPGYYGGYDYDRYGGADTATAVCPIGATTAIKAGYNDGRAGCGILPGFPSDCHR
jgi:hypothetical protein